MKTAFGAVWQILADGEHGGSSKAEFRILPEGTSGGKGSLLISGEVGIRPISAILTKEYLDFAHFKPRNRPRRQDELDLSVGVK